MGAHLKIVFDAYGCTIPVEPATVIGMMREWTGADGDPSRDKPRGFYDFGLSFIDPRGQQFAFIKWGGKHPWPHVECQGVNSQALADLVRSEWPDHSVSRCDPKIDFTGEGCFDRGDALLVPYAVQKVIKIDQRGDWVRNWGRTRYIGSGQSLTLLRWYQKGHQWHDQGLIVEDLNVTRLEAQQRPGQKKLGKVAARLSAEECFGLSQLGVAALKMLAGREVEYIKGAPLPLLSLEQKALNLATQYAATLQELERVHGSPCAVGEYLYALRAEAMRNKSAS